MSIGEYITVLPAFSVRSCTSVSTFWPSGLAPSRASSNARPWCELRSGRGLVGEHRGAAWVTARGGREDLLRRRAPQSTPSPPPQGDVPHVTDRVMG